ncbi:hypothetical protein [Pedobacter agri]|uniref:hypothetical protein n=1 Tax=Pedobacter agri TaxID=454586 RepID=UPI00292CD244|nr:hypothetical protein [Pedobacter agri]
MKIKYCSLVIIALFAMICLSSCAPKYSSGGEYGFFGGLWHGFIVVFSIIGKILGLKIGIYAENNTGFTYWIGFIIGLGGLGRGASSVR